VGSVLKGSSLDASVKIKYGRLVSLNIFGEGILCYYFACIHSLLNVYLRTLKNYYVSEVGEEHRLRMLEN
jgi:hypothetical protein